MATVRDNRKSARGRGRIALKPKGDTKFEAHEAQGGPPLPPVDDEGDDEGDDDISGLDYLGDDEPSTFDAVKKVVEDIATPGYSAAKQAVANAQKAASAPTMPWYVWAIGLYLLSKMK